MEILHSGLLAPLYPTENHCARISHCQNEPTKTYITNDCRTRISQSWRSTTTRSRRASERPASRDAKGSSIRRKWRAQAAWRTRRATCPQNLTRPGRRSTWTTAAWVAAGMSAHPCPRLAIGTHRRGMSIATYNQDCTGPGSILLRNFRRPRMLAPHHHPDTMTWTCPIISVCFIHLSRCNQTSSGYPTNQLRSSRGTINGHVYEWLLHEQSCFQYWLLVRLNL